MIEKIIAALAGFIIAVISKAGYLGVLLLMGIESACVPLPSEIIMPFAGFLVYKGQFNLLLAATAGAIGCNVGSVVAYEIGHYGGRPLLERYGSLPFFLPPANGSGRALFCAFWRRSCFYRAIASCDPDIYCAACRRSKDAASALPCLHLHWLMAVVFCAGVDRHEAG